MKYTKEQNEHWVNKTAAAVRERTGVDIVDLLRDGPGRVLLNLCAQNDRLPGDFADAATIRHIIDWMVASRVRNEAWLSRLDVTGRPLKLMKCGTIERLNHEADKAMKRWNSVKVADTAIGTEVVFECSNGFRVCRLLTPEALDAESGLMGHCVGNGGYDAALEKGEMEIYSLRDGQGRSHVTIEVQSRDRRIVQMMGKANTVVKPEYMRRLIEWFNHDKKLDLYAVDIPSGYAMDRSRKIIELASLKPGDRFDGDLVLRVFEDCEEYVAPLPENLIVMGDLTAHCRMDRRDANLTEPSVILHPPVGIRRWGLDVEGPTIRFANGVTAEGKLTLRGFRAGIVARAFSYTFVSCQIEELPSSVDRTTVFEFCNFPTPIADARFGRNLVINSCGTVEFEGETEVRGELRINHMGGDTPPPTDVVFRGDCHVRGSVEVKDSTLVADAGLKVDGNVKVVVGDIVAPHHVVVRGDFTANGCRITGMPETLEVGGDLDLRWSEIDRWPTEMSVGGEERSEGAKITGEVGAKVASVTGFRV